MCWMPSHNASSMPKNKAPKKETHHGGSFLEKKFSGTNVLKLGIRYFLHLLLFQKIEYHF